MAESGVKISYLYEKLNSLTKVCRHTYAPRQEVGMKRTTAFADKDVLRQLREIARRERITLSEAIRTALGRYVSRRPPKRSDLSLMAIGRSGRKGVAEHAEEPLGS